MPFMIDKPLIFIGATSRENTLSHHQAVNEAGAIIYNMNNFLTCESFIFQTMEEMKHIKLMCLPALHWYPSPNSLYCIPACADQHKGDGFCDCRNNNKHCNYDNGDCCAATVKGGEVDFLDYNSTCKCIDPGVPWIKLVCRSYDAKKIISLETDAADKEGDGNNVEKDAVSLPERASTNFERNNSFWEEN